MTPAELDRLAQAQVEQQRPRAAASVAAYIEECRRLGLNPAYHPTEKGVIGVTWCATKEYAELVRQEFRRATGSPLSSTERGSTASDQREQQVHMGEEFA
jgi:hypothetical protein